MLQGTYTLSQVAASPTLTETTPVTSKISDGQPEVPVPAVEGLAAVPGVDTVGLVGAGVPSGAVCGVVPPLIVPSGTVWGVVPPLAVPSGVVWDVAPEGMDDAAIPLACALLELSDALMSATGLVPSTTRIGDAAVEGVAGGGGGGADCGVAGALPLSDALLSAGPVVAAAFPEGLLPAGLAGVPLEALLLAGPSVEVPDVVDPVAPPGVSEGVSPGDAGRATELAGETAGVKVAGVVEDPAAEEPVF